MQAARPVSSDGSHFGFAQRRLYSERQTHTMATIPGAITTRDESRRGARHIAYCEPQNVEVVDWTSVGHQAKDEPENQDSARYAVGLRCFQRYRVERSIPRISAARRLSPWVASRICATCLSLTSRSEARSVLSVRWLTTGSSRDKK